ncbi:MAG TPA: YraN family protein [Candidatus Paceibacterota bacterium]|nr:YraN family protein [Candidatus Paceibacterota bacterium]
MIKNIETGKIGENIACKYLLNNKYLILARNHRERPDEIDIIGRHPDGTLVFCEVKTLRKSMFMPEDNLTPMKLKKMIRAARIFLMRHPGIVLEEKGWQIDLVAIVLTYGDKVAELRHYKNI